MDSKRAIELINKQIKQIESLKQKGIYSNDFKKWKRDTEVIIEKIFGSTTRHLSDLQEIRYSLSISTSGTTQADHHNAYVRGINSVNATLVSIVGEIEEFGLDNNKLLLPDAISTIENIFNKFHKIVRQLKRRYSNRETLEIKDEYDVQDLLHSILHLYFDDIRNEEWNPSYAGGSSRSDFLLKQEGIVIEVKKTRETLKTRQLGEQLIVDIKKYETHPDCKTLYCFVYDPEGYISNPRGIENDLNDSNNEINVIVKIVP